MEFSTYYSRQLEEHLSACASLDTKSLQAILATLLNCFRSGGKVLLCGNGGSAALCQHLAAEFVVRFRSVRHPLPAIALTTDTSCLTAGANDFGFDSVFARQVEALGQPADVLITCSTSGESTNVLAAAKEAATKELTTIGLCGTPGSSLASICDHVLEVESNETARVQEVHLFAAHTLCGYIEASLDSPWNERC